VSNEYRPFLLSDLCDDLSFGYGKNYSKEYQAHIAQLKDTLTLFGLIKTFRQR
jgi:hypothetical protein